MFEKISKPRFLWNYCSTMLFIFWGWYICFHVSSWHQGMLANSLNLSLLNPVRDFVAAHMFSPLQDFVYATFPESMHSLFPNWMGTIMLDAAMGESARLPAPLLFKFLLAAYAVALVPFYLKYPWLHSKALVFVRGLWLGLDRPSLDGFPSLKARLKSFFSRTPSTNKNKKKKPAAFKPKFSRQTSQAGLSLFLKFFFAPLMVNWCLGHVADMINSSSNVWIYGFQYGMSGRILFDQHLFWALFQAILFIDTLLFTLGYIIETPALKNRIVSVEPTFFGWVVCLACYPWWNQATGMWLPWQSTDFPSFQNDTLHLFMNCGILLLMGIYSWASVALGFRASNLTNRGIVSSGPYRFVRHPAYVAKNSAWWIGALPTIYAAFGNNFRAGMTSIMFTAAWSFIYAMRAITEERHLRMANNGYAEYARKVRWRFIPGLI